MNLKVIDAEGNVRIVSCLGDLHRLKVSGLVTDDSLVNTGNEEKWFKLSTYLDITGARNDYEGLSSGVEIVRATESASVQSRPNSTESDLGSREPSIESSPEAQTREGVPTDACSRAVKADEQAKTNIAVVLCVIGSALIVIPAFLVPTREMGRLIGDFSFRSVAILICVYFVVRQFRRRYALVSASIVFFVLAVYSMGSFYFARSTKNKMSAMTLGATQRLKDKSIYYRTKMHSLGIHRVFEITQGTRPYDRGVLLAAATNIPQAIATTEEYSAAVRSYIAELDAIHSSDKTKSGIYDRAQIRSENRRLAKFADLQEKHITVTGDLIRFLLSEASAFEVAGGVFMFEEPADADRFNGFIERLTRIEREVSEIRGADEL